MSDIEKKDKEKDDHKETKKNRLKKRSLLIPLFLVFIFIGVMVVYTSKLMYSVAISNSAAVIEDRMMNVSSMIGNYLNTAENILHVTADSVHHMLISGSTPARIHEFLVEETNNVSEQFDENYSGLYGYIMSQYMDGLNWEPPEGYDPKSRDWYVTAKESDGDVAFVPPYVDAQTGDMIISVARMLLDRQNIISLDVHLGGIQSMMDELTMNGKGYGFVVDESGLFIAHKDKGKNGTNISSIQGGGELLAAIYNTDSANLTSTYNGQECTVFVNEIMNGWRVVMIVRNSELYADVKNQLVMNVLICSLVFMIIAAFYIFVQRKEQKNSERMEEMKLEEQKAAYERKVLELEKDAANASNKAKSDFLANMSHEIRTPMNAILGMDEMILRSSPGESVRKYALDIRSAGKTLLSIINDILDFSKIESGKMELINSAYSFASVINDVVNMTVNKAQEKGLEYKIRIDEDVPSVMEGDEIRVRQVMLNLINNAIKYTHEGSVLVEVFFDLNEGMLVVTVTDTGIGIKDEDLSRLFGSFERLEEDKNRNIEGTGLGLNITKRLVKMMDGTITVNSIYGEGTTFTVKMRQVVVDGMPVGDFARNLSGFQDHEQEYRTAFTAPSARILVVDDNDMNLEVIEGLLEDTRIRVTTAESGRECIDILREETFDVIFLDQMMPGMSGVQTLEEIGREKLAGDTPVIALTADAIVGARENYIKEGFTDYLSKPVMYDALEAVLLKYLNPELISREAAGEAEPKEPAGTKSKAEEESKDKSKDESGEKPVVIAISESADKLLKLKSVLGDDYKGVFVRDAESAGKYVEKLKNRF